jgi:alpha-1,6-mannosyltransferase
VGGFKVVRQANAVAPRSGGLRSALRELGPPGLPTERLADRVEKHPDRPIAALAEPRRRGMPAVLAVIGDGPRRRALEAQAAGLPVRFFGHVSGRGLVASLPATADVAIAPGPVETFGLAGLEALASGTPVVANRACALPEVIGPAGLAVEDAPKAYADAVEHLLARQRSRRRSPARAQAERFGWSEAVEGFLRAHDMTGRPPGRSDPPRSQIAPAAGRGCGVDEPAGRSRVVGEVAVSGDAE